MPSFITVVTGDIVKSRKYLGQDRVKLQKHLLSSWKKTEKFFSEKEFVSDFAFRITAGDEFQYVCKSFETALKSLTILRIHARLSELDPPVTLRACLATGTRLVKGTADPYTQDGSAFSLAREGLDKLNKLGRQVTLIQYEKNETLAEIANAVLPLTDKIYRRWSSSQCEALVLAVEGKGVVETAEKLKISKQTVSDLRQRASWQEYEGAIEAINKLLKAVSPK